VIFGFVATLAGNDVVPIVTVGDEAADGLDTAKGTVREAMKRPVVRTNRNLPLRAASQPRQKLDNFFNS